MTESNRGQAYTLEGVIAAIILASALLYGLQAVDVAPYTSDDRSDQRLDTLRTQVADSLALAADTGSLERAITCINTSTQRPHERIGQPPNEQSGGNLTDLGSILNGTLGGGDRRYIVRFDYWNTSSPPDGALNYTYVHPNDPGELQFTREPVTVTRQVTLYDSTPVRVPDDAGTPDTYSDDFCRPLDDTLGEWADDNPDFYLPEAYASDANRDPYGVVMVRVIAW